MGYLKDPDEMYRLVKKQAMRAQEKAAAQAFNSLTMNSMSAGYSGGPFNAKPIKKRRKAVATKKKMPFKADPVQAAVDSVLKTLGKL